MIASRENFLNDTKCGMDAGLSVQRERDGAGAWYVLLCGEYGDGERCGDGSLCVKDFVGEGWRKREREREIEGDSLVTYRKVYISLTLHPLSSLSTDLLLSHPTYLTLKATYFSVRHTVETTTPSHARWPNEEFQDVGGPCHLPR